MEKLGIYYIATSNYKDGFEYFRDKIRYFMPNVQKTIIVLSDGLEEHNLTSYDNVNIVVHKIEHLPWPLITLLKFHYIYNYKNNNFDYICYCNADLQFNTNCFTYRFNKDKINLSAHVNSHCFEIVDDFKFAYTKNQQSTAYIETCYKYCMAGFVYGPSKLFYNMCKDIIDMTNKDLMNNIIAERHDESYLNKWVIENKDKCCAPVKFMTKDENDFNIPFVIKETFVKDKDIVLE